MLAALLLLTVAPAEPFSVDVISAGPDRKIQVRTFGLNGPVNAPKRPLPIFTFDKELYLDTAWPKLIEKDLKTLVYVPEGPEAPRMRGFMPNSMIICGPWAEEWIGKRIVHTYRFLNHCRFLSLDVAHHPDVFWITTSRFGSVMPDNDVSAKALEISAKSGKLLDVFEGGPPIYAPDRWHYASVDVIESHFEAVVTVHEHVPEKQSMCLAGSLGDPSCSITTCLPTSRLRTTGRNFGPWTQPLFLSRSRASFLQSTSSLDTRAGKN